MNKLYTIQAEYEQSVWDVAIQEYGGVASVLMLFADNELTPNSELISAQALYIRETPTVISRDVMAEFRKKDTRVVCGQGTLQRMGGIGYMNISGNFIVS